MHTHHFMIREKATGHYMSEATRYCYPLEDHQWDFRYFDTAKGAKCRLTSWGLDHSLYEIVPVTLTLTVD